MRLVTLKPNEQVIDYIERLLVIAKKGEIQSIACAMKLSNRKTASGWSNILINDTSMLGEISILQRDFIDASINLRVDPETGEVDE